MGRGTAFLLILSILFFSCSQNGDKRIVVRLTDSPGDYDEVNIDIQKVEVNNSESGWMELETVSATYDLLKLTDGTEVILADGEFPSGDITQIRLILGPNNNVVIDGVEHALKTPSAQTSGLKINLNETFDDGITYNVLLDFDAARSVVKAGNSGKYNLKPVIKAIAEATTGALQGTVEPVEENVAIYVMSGEDTVGTSYAVADNASWFIGGIEEGTYSIAFDPGEESTYNTAMLKDLVVVTGKVTDTGGVTLELK